MLVWPFVGLNPFLVSSKAVLVVSQVHLCTQMGPRSSSRGNICTFRPSGQERFEERFPKQTTCPASKFQGFRTVPSRSMSFWPTLSESCFRWTSVYSAPSTFVAGPRSPRACCSLFGSNGPPGPWRTWANEVALQPHGWSCSLTCGPGGLF